MLGAPLYTAIQINASGRESKAMKLKTGARGLRTIMEDIMLDIMFVTPDDRTISKVIVNEDTVKNQEPIIERNKEIKDKIETEEKTA